MRSHIALEVIDADRFRKQMLSWCSRKPVFALLDSNGYSNLPGKSALHPEFDFLAAVNVLDIISCNYGNALNELKEYITGNSDWYFGLLGYDLKNEIENLCNEKLLALYSTGKRVVVIIDEAQVLSDEGLEGLRLLSNLETETAKLLHIVLFGQAELDARLKQPNLRQLKQRIAFSYCLRAIKRSELEAYVNHRLTKAGSNYSAIFSAQAFNLLFRASRGIPRLINILCHKALIATFGRGKRRVDGKSMWMAIRDTDSVSVYLKYYTYVIKILVMSLLTVCGIGLYFVVRGYT